METEMQGYSTTRTARSRGALSFSPASPFTAREEIDALLPLSTSGLTRPSATYSPLPVSRSSDEKSSKGSQQVRLFSRYFCPPPRADRFPLSSLQSSSPSLPMRCSRLPLSASNMALSLRSPVYLFSLSEAREEKEEREERGN
jgi:hypothetical protein